MLSIFILENTGYSLTFETSHFPNGSIHHGQLVSGEWELSNSFTFFSPSKCHQNSKPWICFSARTWLQPTVYIYESLKPQPNHRGAGKHDPIFTVQFQSYLLSYVPHMQSYRSCPLSSKYVCPPTVTVKRHAIKPISV